MIVHCQGRIVYRDEAAALSRLVGEILENGSKVVLDLSGVSSIDSAGIGELAFLHTWAQSQNADLKCASPSPLVRELAGSYEPGFSPRNSPQRARSSSGLPARGSLRRLLIRIIEFRVVILNKRSLRS